MPLCGTVLVGWLGASVHWLWIMWVGCFFEWVLLAARLVVYHKTKGCLEHSVMDEVDVWKLVACLAIFISGFLGSGLTPLIMFWKGRRAALFKGRAGGLAQGEDRHNVSIDGACHEPVVTAADPGAVEFHGARLGEESKPVLLTLVRVVAFVERLVTSIGCGVMITTGLVHVLPDAQDDIAETLWVESSGYPLASAICLAGIMLTYTFHMEVHFVIDSATQPAVRMHVLEAGLVVHSVLIGFALGAADQLIGLRGLTIALIFHQLCEGFALGSIVGIAAKKSIGNDSRGDDIVIPGISIVHQLVMVFFFALSTPIGILIGWFGVSSTDNADSVASHGAQGVLSAVAAGILICSALADFLPSLYGTGHHKHNERTSSEDEGCSSHRHHDHSGIIALLALDATRFGPRMVLHLGVLTGAAAMSVLAIWS